VVDEEQRFGVAQKERLKAMATGVDVLTLTVSPSISDLAKRVPLY